MSSPSDHITGRNPAQARLLILASILFISYLCVAIPLPVIPVYVTGQLGLGNGWAGLAVGIAFLSTILTRGQAGALSDRRGARAATARGLAFYAVGALLALAAGLPALSPTLALTILVIGRLLVGYGESLVGVGVIAWGIGIVGPGRSGRVIALIGAAIYGALAVGGPLLRSLSFSVSKLAGSVCNIDQFEQPKPAPPPATMSTSDFRDNLVTV